SAELYDPDTGTWSATASLVQARFFHTATLLRDSRVLVAGGWDDDLFQDSIASAELYDPVSATWSRTGAMVAKRDGHQALLLADGSVLAAGGTISFGAVPHVTYGVLASSELGNEYGEQWAEASALNAPRGDHTATTLLDGAILVVGGRILSGYRTIPLRSVEL